MRSRSLSRWMCRATLLLAVTLCGPSSAAEFDAPVDPRDHLSELDDAAVAKRRELFGARQRGDSAAIEKLTKEFDEIQHQRNEILKRDPRLN